MSPKGNRKYFIVMHGLDSLEALPNFIWNTDTGPKDPPHRYDQVKQGDRWIGFAYTTSDDRERRLSFVTGFYECIQKKSYRRIPTVKIPVPRGKKKAWMIEGEAFGRQLYCRVGVPPINDLLTPKRVWTHQAIIPISEDDFDRIRRYVFEHKLDTSELPLLHREPDNEQELLAMVIHGQKKLGIEKIIRVRTAFPDLLVKIKGSPKEVHLELEVYSQGFFSHRHRDQVRKRRFKKDGKPVAVLCWIDNNKDVRKYVHRVYELQDLFRERKTMRW
jgi:hypothetical protein